MTLHRTALPQISDKLFLTDSGLVTDLKFNHGIEIPHSSPHFLFWDAETSGALADYFRGHLSLARDTMMGFILDTQTYKAQARWARSFGCDEYELREINSYAVNFSAKLREEFQNNSGPIVLNGVVGSLGDVYSAQFSVTAEDAEQYHMKQLSWLAATELDMVTGFFASPAEAIGLVRAAGNVGLPVAISLTLETNGNLVNGQPLGEAIESVDQSTARNAAYFMVHCAHPDHFFHRIEDKGWARRIQGIRCNASRKSHAELNDSIRLDPGNPIDFGLRHRELKMRAPWLNIFGGCCGCDLRHVTEIAQALIDLPTCHSMRSAERKPS